MTIHISICERCGAQYFPARLRCRHCGSNAFGERLVAEACVAAATQVHRLPERCRWNWLVELDAAEHIKLIAVSENAPSIGAKVPVSQQPDGAIVVG